MVNYQVCLKSRNIIVIAAIVLGLGGQRSNRWRMATDLIPTYGHLLCHEFMTTGLNVHKCVDVNILLWFI